MPDIVALAQGPNSCLELLLEAQLQGNLKDGALRLLVSTDDRTRALAEALGIDSLAPAPGASLADQVAARCDPAIIVQTAQERSLPAELLQRHGRGVLAQREALPGQFAGPDPVRQAWEASRRGEIRWSGCHVYQPGADGRAARIVRQVAVPVSPGDDFARFCRRMHQGQRWVLLKGIKQLLYERRNARHRNRRHPGDKRKRT